MFRLIQISIIFSVLVSADIQAQNITVKRDKARLSDAYGSGFEVSLEGTYDEAEAALQKQMKAFGKMKSNENYFIVAEPTVQGTAYASPLYGQVKQLGNLVSVWIGIIEKDWKENDATVVNRDLEQIMHSLGVNFHRDKIQKQIDESLRALQAVERQQQRLVNENKSLNNKVENNKEEKIKLEQSLVNNKTELENLLKRLEQNKKDQDSVQVAGEQIKKVVEMHRERQRKVQ